MTMNKILNIVSVPSTGWLRLENIIGRRAQINDKGAIVKPEIIGLLGMSKSQWYAGIKSGKFPPGQEIYGDVRYWSTEEILKIITDPVSYVFDHKKYKDYLANKETKKR